MQSIQNVISRKVDENNTIYVNGKFYSPGPFVKRKVKPGDIVKITSIMPDGVTLNGKHFIVISNRDYWYEV